MTRATLFGLIGWLTLTLASPLIAQPFTYQGFLQQNGQPVNGTVSMVFRLYDAPTGGNQIGGSIPLLCLCRTGCSQWRWTLGMCGQARIATWRYRWVPPRFRRG